MRKLTVKDMLWIESIAKIQEYYIEKRETHYNATSINWITSRYDYSTIKAQ